MTSYGRAFTCGNIGGAGAAGNRPLGHIPGAGHVSIDSTFRD